MEKFQLDIYDMGLAVENHFNDHADQWNLNPTLVNAKTNLSALLAEIGQQLAIQLIRTTGNKIVKSAKRSALEKEAFTLSSRLSAYAAINDDNDLYNRVHYTASDLLHLGEEELLGVCSILHMEAENLIANLLPFGIDANTLTAFENTRHQFQQVLKTPQEAIARRKAATEKISELVPELTLFLKNVMDPLMVGLDNNQQEFASVYQNVRAINNTATTRLALITSCIDADSSLPVSRVSLQIPGHAISRRSGISGLNNYPHLSQGSYHIEAKHPQYDTQTIPFTIVQGETTKLVIRLKRK